MNKKTLPSLSLVRKTLYADWALRVKHRDGFKCALCGSEENLPAHHWYACDHHAHAARYAINNGITLCYACHIRSVHTRADYVTVNRVMEYMQSVCGVSQEDIDVLDCLVDTELTVNLLRLLWRTFRRPYHIYINSKDLRYVGKKIYYSPVNKTPFLVVGKTVCMENGKGKPDSRFEVKVVTTIKDPLSNETAYRYTLRQMSTEEIEEERKECCV